MSDAFFLQLISYLLPAVVVGLVAIYFFNMLVRNEHRKRLFLLHRDNQKQALPVRLQAYERLALFLERISPSSLLVRVPPGNLNKKDYASLLGRTIEQEFEHNLAQQIYVSPECWNVIKASKNATISNIRKTATREDLSDADELRENILNHMLKEQAPSETGLSYIKRELKTFL